MLTQITESLQPPLRSPRRERQLWHEGATRIPSLGCQTCPEKGICGGLQVKAPVFDCLDLCCGKPVKCDKVCRKHPDFADHVREVGTFTLENIPRVEPLVAPLMPYAIPMLFHGSSRLLAIKTPVVALPLARLFNRRDGSARYQTREALCEAFGVEFRSQIVLSGTDHDAPLERWWGFGVAKRRALIGNLKNLGVSLTTTPNYSLFIDLPRWDDLHAMKRIALIHHEFLSEGLPAALHVNGRTETDFKRWTAFVAGRPEITHLAYEFTTGSAWAGRRQQHAAWLCQLAEQVSRPLTLVVRGGVEVLPRLGQSFSHLTLLDTSSFMKTMMRKRASVNGHVDWLQAPTEKGTPVDDLFAHNVSAIQEWIEKVASSNNR